MEKCGSTVALLPWEPPTATDNDLYEKIKESDSLVLIS